MKDDNKNSQIMVIATLQAKEGKRQELLEILTPLVKPAREEEGNISYDLYYSTDNPDEFLFDEVWSDKEAFDKHYESPKSNKDREAVKSLLIKPLGIKIYVKV